MSEDRSKRKSKEVRSNISRKLLAWCSVALLFALAYFAGFYYKTHKYDGFAKCLASKQAKMYGLFWCPHCADQKQVFGASFHYVPYVECAIKGQPKVLAPECKAAGVKLFPSWQFGANAPEVGVLSLQELGEKTGCSLP